MKIRTVLKPGQRGTKSLVKEYGSQLICVRYRYDYFRNKKYKTIELVIHEDDWHPPPLHPDDEKPKQVDVAYTREVGVRIGWDEKEIQQTIKSIGGIWSPKDKLWFIDEASVKAVGLGDRIVD